MAAQFVAEMEGHLRDMWALKAPGATNTKINAITEICNANIQVR